MTQTTTSVPHHVRGVPQAAPGQRSWRVHDAILDAAASAAGPQPESAHASSHLGTILEHIGRAAEVDALVLLKLDLPGDPARIHEFDLWAPWKPRAAETAMPWHPHVEWSSCSEDLRSGGSFDAAGEGGGQDVPVFAVPVFVGPRWWGDLVFVLGDREWAELETSAARVAAGVLAAVLARQLSDEIAREKEFALAIVHEELELRVADLARSNSDLEQFAYVASHDLQEPLRMVSSYVDLLAHRYHGQLDDDADEFIDFAVNGVRRMQAMIEAVLAYSRIGRSDAPALPTHVLPIVRAVLGDLKRQVRTADVRITVDPLSTVLVDPEELRQIFHNLLGNALKFCTEIPRVVVAAEREGADWRFSIRDNGIGIDAESSIRVFDIFKRLHSVDEYEGTGLGLAICRKLVERHGGQIWIEQGVEAGATFRFTLPAAESPAPIPARGAVAGA